MSLDEFLADIQRLKDIEQKHIHDEANKKAMSDEIFKLNNELYGLKSIEEHKKDHMSKVCRTCRNFACGKCPEIEELPDDIMKPIKSESNWICGKRGCKHFEWD